MLSKQLEEIEAYLAQADQLVATEQTTQAAKALTTAIFSLKRYYEGMGYTYGDDFRANIKKLAEISNDISRLSAVVMDVGLPANNKIATDGRKKGHESRTRT